MIADAVELQKSIGALNAMGVATEDILVAEQIENVLGEIGEGDQVVVTDLTEVGSSLSSIFSAISAIYTKKASIYSIGDEWINRISKEEDFLEIIDHINMLNSRVISKRTRRGLKMAVKSGKTLGRPVGVKLDANGKYKNEK